MEKKLEIPKIGFGTWELQPRETCTQAVLKAIEIGYRFIDTAQIYKNEDAVGDAIKESPVPRNELVIATKIWVTNLSYKKVLKSFEKSRKRLKTYYVYMLYDH
ncbi:MAG: aldo/keto reductase [Promethearchaeota archaeon]